MIEIPLMAGILILLIISVIFAKFYRQIISYIGERIRKFFSSVLKKIKN